MKGRFRTTSLALLFFASTCYSQVLNPTITNHAGPSFRAPNLNSVSGVVVAIDGTPIADAHVELRNENTGHTVASGYTNENGAFEFAGLPSAPCEVVAISGLSEAREHVGPDGPVSPKIRLDNSNQKAVHADGNATVSVAEYKVPQKARDALHKAQATLGKNKPEETATYLAKALEIYPDYAPALTLRGVLALDRSDANAAMNDFDKAIHADPGFALAYTAMTAALNQLNKFDDALRSAERAITLAPRSWQSYFEMAKAYVGKADYPHALQQLSKAQSLNPKEYAPIHLVRAHVMLATKDYSNAMNELQEFLKLAPQDPNSASARSVLEKVKAAVAASAGSPSVVHSVR